MFIFHPSRIAKHLADQREGLALSGILEVIRRAWAAVRRAIGAEPAPIPVPVPVRRLPPRR